MPMHADEEIERLSHVLGMLNVVVYQKRHVHMYLPMP
jgi:hypothetical protein